MILSNYLAEVWGISIVVICLSLLIKPEYLKKIFSEIENETSMFFWGFITFVIGITMVLAHNVWAKDWQVIVTLLGWISLIKGLTLLFCPKSLVKFAKKMENASYLPFALIIGVFIGLAVTYLGFTAV
jgi:uncharacterized membrane protein